MRDDEALALLRSLSHELRDVDIGKHITRVRDISPLTFVTEFVAKNKPCIIEGALTHWPAVQLWTPEYLTRRLGDLQVTVDVTPNGRGDAVTLVGDEELFVTPDERRMTLGQFFKFLTHSRSSQGTNAEVPYVQHWKFNAHSFWVHQNNNLSKEFSQLLDDVQPRLDWADEVFGGPPEATNLWIGDERSVTSFHKDHYENLYSVISGTKRFTMLPPSDVYRMHLVRYPTAHYERAAIKPAEPAALLLSSQQAWPQPKMLQQPEAGQLPQQQLRAIRDMPPSSSVWSAVDPDPQGADGAV